jgi:hypothetical protein
MTLTRDLFRSDYGWRLLVHPERYQQLLTALHKDNIPLIPGFATNGFIRNACSEIFQTPYVAKSTYVKRRRFYFKRKRKSWERKYKTVEVPILGYLQNMWGARQAIYG